jgi:hypothetical protein
MGLPMPKKRILMGCHAIKKKKRTRTSSPPSKKAPRPKLMVKGSWQISAQGTISLVVPLLTISEANTAEHWTKSSARHKKQKQIIKLHYLQVKQHVSLPCHIHIVRLAPRRLDYDNLVISNKYLVDSICEELTGNYIPGQADSDPRITISYDQEKSKEYGVKILFDCNPYHIKPFH